MAAKKKTPARKAVKKAPKVRCSFRVDEAKLRRFHQRAARQGHDLDELFYEFVRAYESGVLSGAKLGLEISVRKKSKS